MTENFLKYFPSPSELAESQSSDGKLQFIANNHIHSPYSFSSFDDIGSIFLKATEESVNVLGINDFFVTDGYDSFCRGCLGNNVFPLFNIEFIGLMKKEQETGIRINDPNNPGRIYFCGKGLDYPFHVSGVNLRKLEEVINESQAQIRAMIAKLNAILSEGGYGLRLDYDPVRKRYARNLVRERHIARALRVMAEENFTSENERIRFFETIFKGKKLVSALDNAAAIENEIRANVLKSGGSAFVEEDERSFLPVREIIGIINDCGGIPCYPVLLDDNSGRYTEFESDPAKLFDSLTSMGVGCIELIPGRNALKNLVEFTEFFDSRDFVITFGTEHNSPGISPLTISARGSAPLGEKLEQIQRKGVSLIAAHQYLRAKNETGYTGHDGRPLTRRKKELESLGESVIEYFLRGKYHENRNS